MVEETVQPFVSKYQRSGDKEDNNNFMKTIKLSRTFGTGERFRVMFVDII